MSIYKGDTFHFLGIGTIMSYLGTEYLIKQHEEHKAKMNNTTEQPKTPGPQGAGIAFTYPPQPSPQDKTPMTEQPKTLGITHPELRKQWVDDMAKDPNCVWRVRGKGATAWCSYNPGEQPKWYGTYEYSPVPKTKRYYMVMVTHKGVGKTPFALTFPTQGEIKPYLDSFQLDQVGDVVPRDVEQ